MERNCEGRNLPLLRPELDGSASSESLRSGNIKLESFCRARPDNLVEGDLNRQAGPIGICCGSNRACEYAVVDERGVERLATSVLHFDASRLRKRVFDP